MNMYRPTIEESRDLVEQGFRTIPVSRTILADVRTPIEVLQALMRVDNHCYILESIEDRQRWGRYTILGFEPVLEFVCENGFASITERGITHMFECDDPSDVIKDIVKRYRSPRLDYLPPFTGGLVGYFSYDYIKYAEPSLKIRAKDDENFKDVDLMLFDKVIIFDNFRQTITVITHACYEDIEHSYVRATAEVERIIDIIKHGKPADHVPANLRSDFRAMFSEE